MPPETTYRMELAEFAVIAERLLTELQGRTLSGSVEMIRADRERNGRAP